MLNPTEFLMIETSFCMFWVCVLGTGGGGPGQRRASASTASSKCRSHQQGPVHSRCIQRPSSRSQLEGLGYYRKISNTLGGMD